jgi:fumarate reductase subunit D
MAKSNEPLWWAPFMAGAGLAAFFMPATIFLTSIAVAAGWLDEDRLWRLLNNPFVRLYVFLLIALPLFHAAHRLRFILVDLGLKAAHKIIAVLCYGSAIVGTVLAALLALHIAH